METKKRRGRPAGAKNKETIVRVSLSDLIGQLSGDYKVPVKRSWAVEVLGLEEEDVIQAKRPQVEEDFEDETEDEEDDYAPNAVQIIDPKDL